MANERYIYYRRLGVNNLDALNVYRVFLKTCLFLQLLQRSEP